MKKIETELYLLHKRDEIVWSLAKQGYTSAQINRMFGTPRSTVHAIISRMPDSWLSPWVKK